MGEMSEARAADLATFASLLNLLSLYIYEHMAQIQVWSYTLNNNYVDCILVLERLLL